MILAHDINILFIVSWCRQSGVLRFHILVVLFARFSSASASFSYKCKFDNAAACTKTKMAGKYRPRRRTGRQRTRWKDEGWQEIIAQGEGQPDKGHAGKSIVNLVSLILEERTKEWDK
jgi:hypothetical protein